MNFKVSYRKRFFRLLLAVALVLCFLPSIVLAGSVNVTGDKTISADVADTQQKFTAVNKTLTINSGITLNRAGNNTVLVNGQSGTTIVINSGATISTSGVKNKAINAENAANLTVTNSGTISVAAGTVAIKLLGTSAAQISNNAGGKIYAKSDSINGTATTTNATITNSGEIYITNSANAIAFENVPGATITNSAGGKIYNQAGTGAVIYLGSSSTLTNSGTIQHIKYATTNYRSIRAKGDNNTIILKDGGLVIGMIAAEPGTTGNKLQFDHGFGRTYFYETSGDFTLEDLSGNTVVKGSAGSVSLGGQETVDELLGLRTYNLRSSLKRYASAPKPSDKNMVWGETFGYSSKRGGTDTLLQYDTYGYGMNFIHPVTSKLDLILSVEQNDLDFPEDYEVSRTGFLAGVNVSEFSGFGKGNWKAGGFAVAGMGWHNSKREILTNTTASGLLDVTADYESVEVLTGLHINHTYQSLSKGWMKNKLETEIGVTLQGSRTGDYNERAYFFFEERTLLQESFYIGEQLTSTFNDRLGVTLGVEVERRWAISGKTQTYRINGTPTDYTDGSFSENSASANLGLNYPFGWFGPSRSKLHEGLAYIQLNGRMSDETRGTYGGQYRAQAKLLKRESLLG